MYIRLTRLHQEGAATTGEMTVDGTPICETLENSHKMIATGMYPVRVTMSPHFGMLLPLIDRVIGRTGIRIHPGNTPADSEGCVLVGNVDERHNHLLNSKRCFNTLMPLLLTAQRRHEEIWIEVVDETPETISRQRGYDIATHYGVDHSIFEPKAVYVFQDTTKTVK